MDFNCWRCYIHEHERVVIGGLCNIEIETIRNIWLSQNLYTSHEYILRNMFAEWGLLDVKPSDADVSCLSWSLDCGWGAAVDNSLPVYIETLFIIL